jgi:hypothetical protein
MNTGIEKSCDNCGTPRSISDCDGCVNLDGWQPKQENTDTGIRARLKLTVSGTSSEFGKLYEVKILNNNDTEDGLFNDNEIELLKKRINTDPETCVVCACNTAKEILKTRQQTIKEVEGIVKEKMGTMPKGSERYAALEELLVAISKLDKEETI